MKLLVLNAGSSSHKCCLYDVEHAATALPPAPLWEAAIDWTVEPGWGQLTVEAIASNGDRATLAERLDASAKPAGLDRLLATLITGPTAVIAQPSDLTAVGHRVVHGGDRYSAATLLTPTVRADIARLIPLAPNHNPAHLEGIAAVDRFCQRDSGPAAPADVPQIAVFDTAFHSQMPAVAATYPIPYEWFERGVRRYGFHGTSHRYCAHRLASLLDRPLDSLKIITCHLGNGCSLAAIRDGISVDTTMGFTPLEGLMMGTRSGSIDPAILLYWWREAGMNGDEIDRILNRESGFKGVSGVAADVRTILQAIADGNPRAQLAFDLFVRRIQKEIGAMLPVLGGLDALVFTAGVGENAAMVRAAVCDGFGFLGWRLDPQRNDQRRPGESRDRNLAAADSAIAIWTIHTQEDWAIAQECRDLLHTTQPQL